MLKTLTILLTSILAASVAQVLLKVGLAKAGGVTLESLISGKTVGILISPVVAASILLHVLSLMLWLIVLSSMDLSMVYPLVSIGYVFTAMLATVFLDEQINLSRGIGIFLIVVGSFFLLRS
jgi:uncharacterized membrane protein